MSEPTITAAGKTMTVGELTQIIYDKLLGDALAAGEQAKESITKTVAACKHNIELLEALEDGTDFRIAFKKKGATEWTRVRVEEEDALQAAAIEEVGLRQVGLMTNLADVLGMDTFALNI